MKRLLIAILMISLSIPVFCIELSEPDPEDTRRITAIIQYTSEFRFGDNLKEGDEVVYEVNEDEKSEEYADHILKVIDRNDATTTVLELFEGNELYVEFLNETKEVIRIWGKDIAGGDHNLTLLTENELVDIVAEVNNNADVSQKISKWKVTNSKEDYEVKNNHIQCQEIELDVDNLDLPESTKDLLRKNKAENSILLSGDVPKMLPLIPVAFISLGKKELLRNSDAGFVKNSNLKLKSFKRGE